MVSSCKPEKAIVASSLVWLKQLDSVVLHSDSKDSLRYLAIVIFIAEDGLKPLCIAAQPLLFLLEALDLSDYLSSLLGMRALEALESFGCKKCC